MTSNLQQHISTRANAIAEAAVQEEYDRIMEQLEGHPNMWKLEGMIAMLAAAAAESAWIDGWQCAMDPGRLVFRYDHPLFVATADNFLNKARQAMQERMPGLEWFALQCEAIIEIDSTGVDAVQALAEEVNAAGIRFTLVRAKSELVETLAKTPLVGQIGEDYIFPTLPTLVGAYRVRNGSDGEGSAG